MREPETYAFQSQTMKQDFKSGQSIVFISDGRAADGSARELVVSQIVMDHVQMDVAEAVFRGCLKGEDGLCEVGRSGRIKLRISRREAATVILEASAYFRWGLSTKS